MLALVLAATLFQADDRAELRAWLLQQAAADGIEIAATQERGAVEPLESPLELSLAQGRTAFVTQTEFRGIVLTHLYAEDLIGELEHVATWDESRLIHAFYALDVNQDGVSEILMEATGRDDYFDHVLFGINPGPMPDVFGGHWRVIHEVQPADTIEGGFYLVEGDEGTSLITVGYDQQRRSVWCSIWPEAAQLREFQNTSECPDVPERDLRQTHQRIEMP